MNPKLQKIKSALRHSIELAEKATPGPWSVPHANIHRVIAHNGKTAVRLIVEHPEQDTFFGKDDISYFRLGEDEGGKQSAADRAFIAHARTFAPAAAKALLVAIEGLEEIVRRRRDIYSKEYGTLTLETICREWPDTEDAE